MTVAIEVTGKLERAAEVTNELIGVVEIKLMTEVNDAFIEIIGVAEIIIELIILVDTSYELMEITDELVDTEKNMYISSVTHKPT